MTCPKCGRFIPKLKKALKIGEELEKHFEGFPVPVEVYGVEVVEEGTLITILISHEEVIEEVEK